MWLREMARDIVSLGGFPFFVLVLVRVWMLDNLVYFSQFVVAGIVVGLVFLILRQNIYSGLGLIVLVFTSLYYDDFNFTIFGIVAYVLLLVSLFYLKEDKKKILLGVVLGALGVAVSYVILGISFKYPNF